MKKYIALAITITFFCFVLIGCGTAQTTNLDKTIAVPIQVTSESLESMQEENPPQDRIPMVMIDGEIYYDTGKESTVTGRCGVMDGTITATVERTQIPDKDNQSNFGSGYEYQYGLENTIEIFMNEKWFVFRSHDSNDGQIQYGEAWYPTKDLSAETIEWLYWFNSLPSDDQLAISAVPADLLALMNLSHPQADDTATP